MLKSLMLSPMCRQTNHQLVGKQTRFKPMKRSKRAFPLSFGPWTSLLPDTSLPVRKLFAKVAGAAQCLKSSPLASCFHAASPKPPTQLRYIFKCHFDLANSSRSSRPLLSRVQSFFLGISTAFPSLNSYLRSLL